MKITGIILLLLSYLPMFFLKAYRYYYNIKLSELGDLFNGLTIHDLFNDVFGIFTALGVAFYLWGDYIISKKPFLIPLACLFSVVGLTFILNISIHGFYKTFWPVLIIIICVLLCYIIIAFLYYKYRQRVYGQHSR